MCVHLVKSVAHVVEVHTDVPESGLDVLVVVELRNRLDRGPRVIEVAAERPSEGVVAEVHLKAVADLVDHRTIQAVTPLGVGPPAGLSTQWHQINKLSGTGQAGLYDLILETILARSSSQVLRTLSLSGWKGVVLHFPSPRPLPQTEMEHLRGRR